MSEEIIMGVRYVNGKYYPVWQGLVNGKALYIGGKLTDFGDAFDKSLSLNVMETTIKDMELRPNGESSAFFAVIGEDFTCGFDVKVGSISPYGPGMGMTFEGYGGHEWHIQRP